MGLCWPAGGHSQSAAGSQLMPSPAAAAAPAIRAATAVST
jgi:hypothetical protein